jgi:hypothetical protein
MGMFDYVSVYCSLPIDAPDWVDNATIFRCKQTEAQYTENYAITKEGHLIHHSVQWESVPEEERPFYGKPEWNNGGSWYKSFGCMRSIPAGNVEIKFNGYLCLTAMTIDQPYHFYECVAKFTDGQLQWIRSGCECMDIDP